MTGSNNNQLPSIIKKMEEAILDIKKVQSELEEWKSRALHAENLNERLTEKNQKSERKITTWKNRANRAVDTSHQPFVDERDPVNTAGSRGSRARPSSRLAPRTLSPRGGDDDTDGNRSRLLNELDSSKHSDDLLLEFDGGDSCTFLVSDQEESLLSEIPIEKKMTSSDWRRSKKFNRTSAIPKVGSRSIKSNSKRFDEKRKVSPTPGDTDSSDEDSSVEAMNILNGYLELRGQYDVSGRKNARRERGFS